jgi:hypothetical protein
MSNVGLFGPDSSWGQVIAFNHQLEWGIADIYLANMLVDVGFTRFAINGFGQLVAKTSYVIRSIDVEASYIPDVRQLRLAVDGHELALVDGINSFNSAVHLHDTVTELVNACVN